MDEPTLILSPRHSESSQVLWRKALENCWNIERFPNWKIPEDFKPEHPVIYGEPLFNQMMAEHLGLTLPEPPEDFLLRLPTEFLRRTTTYTTAGAAREDVKEPQFIKPPNKKTFKAAVYESGAGIPIDVPDDERVLVQSIVEFVHEYRLFFMGGRIATGSSYMINGVYAKTEGGWNDPPEIRNKAMAFGQAVGEYFRMAPGNLLNSVVLDVGYIKGRGWAVVEANEINASGCYNADPFKVLLALYYSTNPPGLDPYRANFYEDV
jgi:hypothetical protein